MKVIIVAALAFAAYAAAAPSSSSVHIDVYRNLLAPTNRIHAGEKAQKREFPYQISLHLEMFPGYTSHICGGTVLDSTTVVTAAHCLASSGTYYVLAGLLKQSDIDGDVQAIEVEDFIIREGYPGGDAVAPNDIAILKLKKPLILNEAVQAVRLPTEEECNAIETSTLSGWGLTSESAPYPDHLQRAHLPRIINEKCASDLIDLLGDAGPLDSTMICTSQSDYNQGSCLGDSGGPLVLKDSKCLVGVVSWGVSPCGTKGAPSVYTRVCSHLSFIQQHME